MDNPGQFLIHFTNRGPKVFASEEGMVGEFKVAAKQPLKDINKFGMLQYSIPKMCDHVDDGNRFFFLNLTYANGSEIAVPVRMPDLDYYNMYVSQEYDKSIQAMGNQGRRKDVLSFDEVLQTTLNWAIMLHADTIYANPAGRSFAELCLNRVGVVVGRNSDGCLDINVGYRGWTQVVNNQDMSQSFQPGVQQNTGSPFQYYNCILPGGTVIDGGQPIPNAGGLGVNAPNNNPLNGRANFYNTVKIVKVGFTQLPMRMQMFLGVDGSDLVSAEELQATITRGRVRITNYNTAAGNSGLIQFKCNIPPNLDPPSFMYLQLTVPGTRSKILGQSDERGGWAIPTAPNLYASNYMNFPAGRFYHPQNVRYAPAVTSEALYVALFANKPVGNNPSTSGIGFNFDYIPLGATAQVNIALNIARIDNYHLGADPFLPRSRLVRIGRLTEQKVPVAPKRRYGRHARDEVGGTYNSGFGIGQYRQSSVFTVSLIEPNYVFTSVENATMQTFDVRLMWGDTSEQVDGIAGNPVQFSLIASP